MANLLKALLDERHMHAYSEFIAEYKRAARELDLPRNAVPPTKSQYYRWVGGQVRTLPQGHHCVVLERMFSGWTAKELFGHEQPREPSVAGDDDVLVGIGPGLDPALLAGVWATGYLISGGYRHVDLSTVDVRGAGMVSRNYPPAPRFEGHSAGHETDVTARLFGRHLMGHFRNHNDRYFFGSLHLVMLPGETILDGYYTGFLNDAAVVAHPWRWVRVDPRTVEGVDLNAVTLGDPAVVYDALAGRNQFDGPLALSDIVGAA
ncbi:hypothetical protein BRW65_22890 [Mycobacterium paraffinicum]|uniref:Uncharacterized protein n=1 Tax=Mycobacterium paraffinicum TaxID=53378 RepID=A0A1Q4HP39_9MYCO|nr:hypothetical protein [Mycobacterium paraffinicum]OJZ69456.1 hypothetical protein BRW65_22890 [Mycobacterium paraffinicum]